MQDSCACQHTARGTRTGRCCDSIFCPLQHIPSACLPLVPSPASSPAGSQSTLTQILTREASTAWAKSSASLLASCRAASRSCTSAASWPCFSCSKGMMDAALPGQAGPQLRRAKPYGTSKRCTPSLGYAIPTAMPTQLCPHSCAQAMPKRCPPSLGYAIPTAMLKLCPHSLGYLPTLPTCAVLCLL